MKNAKEKSTTIFIVIYFLGTLAGLLILNNLWPSVIFAPIPIYLIIEEWVRNQRHKAQIAQWKEKQRRKKYGQY